MTKLKINGSTVSVDQTIVDDNVIEIVAVVGTTTHKTRMTVGAEDGPRPDYTASTLQSDVDQAKQSAAEEAVYRENIKNLLKQLK
jgi:hypothetical protein